MLDDVLGPADNRGRIAANHLANNQPIIEHPDRRQVLLDAWRRACLTEILDVAGDMHRLDGIKTPQPSLLAPAEEFRHRPGIGSPGIGIADIGGEELDKADGGVLSGRGDLHRNDCVGSGNDQVVAHKNIVPFSTKNSKT